MRKITWTPEQIRKRVATQARLRAEGKFQETLGAMPVFPIGHDDSGLRSHSFEDFVSSPAYQENVKKLKRQVEKRAHKGKSYVIGNKEGWNTVQTNKKEDIMEVLTPDAEL